MDNTITIYWDTQDYDNVGFSWRNDEESGQIENEEASEHLRELINGGGGSVTGRDALAAEMLAAGHEIEECHLSFGGFSCRPDLSLS